MFTCNDVSRTCSSLGLKNALESFRLECEKKTKNIVFVIFLLIFIFVIENYTYFIHIENIFVYFYFLIQNFKYFYIFRIIHILSIVLRIFLCIFIFLFRILHILYILFRIMLSFIFRITHIFFNS